MQPITGTVFTKESVCYCSQVYSVSVAMDDKGHTGGLAVVLV